MTEDENSDLPQWVLDGLTDIRMAARDPSIVDEEFMQKVAAFVKRVSETDA